MISATTIFSTLGNNSSLAPVILKDSVDNAGRVAMAYTEGSRESKRYGFYDARERFIEEYATSLVWMGGIPLLKNIYDRAVTNKIYKFAGIENLGSTFDKKGKRVLADTNLNLVIDESAKALGKRHSKVLKILAGQEEILNLVKPEDFSSAASMLKLKETLQQFRPKNKEANETLFNVFKQLDKVLPAQILSDNLNKIEGAVGSNNHLKTLYGEAKKIIDNPIKFKKVQAGKMGITTLIPLAMVGFILPKMIQKLTRMTRHADREKEQKESYKNLSAVHSPQATAVFSSFMGQNDKKQGVSFKGTLGNTIVNIFNNDLCNQAILDAGISGGRIITGVNTADKIEKAIKEAGIVFFIYLGGRVIADMFEKVGQAIGLPISLDSQILEDKNFQNEILNIAKSAPEKQAELTKNLLKFTKMDDELSIVNFVKGQIKNGIETVSENGKTSYVFKNNILKAANKLGYVDLIDNVQNPLQMINTKKIKSLNDSMNEFVKKALSKGSPEEVEKFLKKALNAKRGSIVLNLAVCSISTAYFLPKLQYLFREKYTKSTRLPALDSYDKDYETKKTSTANKVA